MTTPSQENQEQIQESQKQNDKDYNFAQIRRQLEQERAEKAEMKERLAQAEKAIQEHSRPKDDDDDDDEPYIDKKKLNKTLNRVVPQIREDARNDVRVEVQKALQQERQQNWLKSNPDFYDVMQHAQKFAEKDPELAETILEMPEGFERQKLVYKNIKALGLHKKEEPKSSIQGKIDQNRRSPYYQPSGTGTAPYAATGDFSPVGQKSAYDKMKELQARLRI